MRSSAIKMTRMLMAGVMLLVLLSPGAAKGETAGTRHISTVLESPFLRLELEAEVTEPALGSPIKVYQTDYARADDGKWRELFFGSADAVIEDLMAGWDLEKQKIHYPELERRYSAGSVYTAYTAYETRIDVEYREKEVSVWWSFAQADAQADGQRTTPAQATQMAQAWVDDLAAGIGWDGLMPSSCLAMPASTPGYLPGDEGGQRGGGSHARILYRGICPRHGGWPYGRPRQDALSG